MKRIWILSSSAYKQYEETAECARCRLLENTENSTAAEADLLNQRLMHFIAGAWDLRLVFGNLPRALANCSQHLLITGEQFVYAYRVDDDRKIKFR